MPLHKSLFTFVKMQFNKLIISIFFLLTYSVGFAHNIVPHCAGESDHYLTSTSEDGHHHHSHHNHENDDIDKEHRHIVHEDHYDSNFFDYVVCLLNDTEHHGIDCQQELCFIPNSEVFSVKNLIVSKFLLLVKLYKPIVIEDEQSYSIDVNLCSIYLSPPIESCAHRGPPTFSC